MPLSPEFTDQVAEAPRRPAEWGLGVASSAGFYQRLEVGAQGGILGDSPLAPSPGSTDPMSVLQGRSVEVLDAPRDGAARGTGGAMDGRNSAPTQRLGLGREDQSTTSLVQMNGKPGPCVFGLAEPSLSEPLSGDVRVPSPHVESSYQLVDGLGDHLASPQPLK